MDAGSSEPPVRLTEAGSTPIRSYYEVGGTSVAGAPPTERSSEAVSGVPESSATSGTGERFADGAPESLEEAVRLGKALDVWNGIAIPYAERCIDAIRSFDATVALYRSGSLGARSFVCRCDALGVEISRIAGEQLDAQMARPLEVSRTSEAF
jgi:hypothetical protein